jgi:hypothetical protein
MEVVETGLIELLASAMNLDEMDGNFLMARVDLDAPFGFAADGLDSFEADGGVDVFQLLFRVQLLIEQQMGHLPGQIRLEIRRKCTRDGPIREWSLFDALPGSIGGTPFAGGGAVAQHLMLNTANGCRKQ